MVMQAEAATKNIKNHRHMHLICIFLSLAPSYTLSAFRTWANIKKNVYANWSPAKQIKYFHS